MESPSRFELTKAEIQNGEETELGEVKVTLPTNTVATSTPVQPGTIPCRNGGCKSWTSRAESRMESPWHFLKTIFLVSVIVALILWIIVYTFLAQYQVVCSSECKKPNTCGQKVLEILTARSLTSEFRDKEIPSVETFNQRVYHSRPVIDAPEGSTHLASNLKRENERTIARHLESFLSRIRDLQGGTSRQNDPGKESDEAKENATTVSEPTKKKATGAKVNHSNKLRGDEIRLSALDRPGSSKSPQFNKIPATTKSGPSKVKSTQSKATQMRQNSSSQRLQGNEDIDDDYSSSGVEDAGRSKKYVLVGWDNFRSKLMIILLVLFVLWAVIYFPLTRI
ncbi:unnamed protein product [Heterotrigona itama]|uniref:Uncharacterized protein n=1 Tax=Heterotrigona itama TaxID=395501 RepID=A0A6V7GZM2_9HYME|nr:unnamed protein product [Heterotrigona itama]